MLIWTKHDNSLKPWDQELAGGDKIKICIDFAYF